MKESIGLIGINEYKLHSIKIHEDVDDIDLWFSENSSRFLPEGRSADEFIYSYEKCFEDEEITLYWTALARKDYICNILKSCSNKELTIIGIYPFILSVMFLELLKEENTLFIDLLSSRIQFSFRFQTGSSYYGELYKESDLLSENRDKQAAYDLYVEIMKDIKDSLIIWRNTNDISIDHIYINSPDEYSTVIKEASSEIFSEVTVNKHFETADTGSIAAVFTLDNFLNNYDSCINLLTEENRKEEKEKLEKSIALKLALVSGSAIIILLLLSNLLHGFITSAMESNEEELLTINNQSVQIERLVKQKEILKSNLAMFLNLKGYDKSRFSYLLEEITEIVTDKTCLLDLAMNEISENKISLEMTGCAYSQTDVAEIIKRMEDSNSFSGITLGNSIYVEKNKIGKDVRISQKEVVKFNVTAEYNVN